MSIEGSPWRKLPAMSSTGAGRRSFSLSGKADSQ